jgi:hypothetical protein
MPAPLLSSEAVLTDWLIREFSEGVVSENSIDARAACLAFGSEFGGECR